MALHQGYCDRPFLDKNEVYGYVFYGVYQYDKSQKKSNGSHILLTLLKVIERMLELVRIKYSKLPNIE